MARQEQPSIDTASIELRRAAEMESASGAADDALMVPVTQIQPPWHVRHARVLLAGFGVAATAGIGYGAFYLWQLTADPLSNLTSMRAPSVRGTIAIPPTPKPPPRIAAPALAPASPPAPAARAVGKPAPAVAPAIAPAPRVQATKPAAVTHTRPAEPAQIPTAQAPALGGRACTEAVAALGLCSPASGGERR